jgi:hypothetical protein
VSPNEYYVVLKIIILNVGSNENYINMWSKIIQDQIMKINMFGIFRNPKPNENYIIKHQSSKICKTK